MLRPLIYNTDSLNRLHKRTKRVFYATDENFAKIQIYHDKLKEADKERRDAQQSKTKESS